MEYKLEELINIGYFQSLLDRLNEIYSFPSTIADNTGNILTTTAWQDICTKFHRKNKQSESQCIKSDRYILDHLAEANPAVVYRCPHGLIETATPIIINGKHLGIFFIGQFFLEKPDLAFFRKQAKQYGFDEEQYIEAVRRVPVWTQQKLDQYLFFIKGLIAVIAETGLKNLKEIESRRKIRESEDQHRAIIQMASDGFWELDLQGRFLQVNEAYCRMSGYSAQELMSMSVSEIEVVETPNDTAAHIKKLMAEGQTRFETKHRRKDGSVYDLEVSAQYQAAGKGRLVAFLRDITDKKQSEEALRASEEKFRQIFFANADSININRLTDGMYVSINQGFTEMTGYTEADVIGKTSVELNIWVDPADRAQVVERLRKNGEVKNYEAFFRAKDGRILTGLMSGKVIEIDHVLYNASITRDITEYKAHEREIERLNRLYSVLSHVNQTVVKVQSRQELFSEVCRVLVEYGGLKQAWIGWHDPSTHRVMVVAQHGDETGYLKDIRVYADDRPEGCGPTGTAVKEGKPFVSNDFLNDTRTLPWRKAAALTSWRSAAAFPIRFEDAVRYALTVYAPEKNYFGDREVLQLEEIATTISFGLDTLKNEAQKNENEKRFRMLFESMTDGFALHEIICDKQNNPCNYRFLEVNPAFESLTGLKAGDITGKTALEILPNLDKSWIETYGRVALTGKSEHFARFNKDLQRSYEITAYSPQPGRFATIVTDVTEKQKLEDQLRQSQKLESLGALAGGIAHDFNNILTAIIGYANIAQIQMAEDDPKRLNIEHILDASNHAANLTKDLLLFSRKQQSAKQTVDLNEIVKKVERFLKRIIDEDIDCRISLSKEAMPILADSHQLEQVLINLASNARDAMPGGGTLSITTASVQLHDATFAINGDAGPGRYVLLTVSDTGMGMDEATRKRIFEPFFTTKNVGKGTGLGLAVVYGIVRQHEGFINVYSEPGHGTVFKIYLPFMPLDREQAEMEKSVETAPQRGTETILLAEDNEMVRNLNKTVLKEFGYKVIEAIDGETAISSFMQHKNEIKLLMFDSIMPKKTGKAAYDEIKAIQPDIKIIFLSGYAPELVRQRFQLDDTVVIASKPISPKELLKLVRSTLDRV